ncbi:hypothetical protein F4808DRAFT_412307 [Astrocystis sublimbata]|nr:hypothetical protein F4808DRAFT_412307 [Astrocystis sublimbata]
MPAHGKRQQAVVAAPSPAPAPKKYTNKDGTKYISVPKSSASTPPAQPSPTTTSSSRGGAPTNGQVPAEPPPPLTTVNKKKQKRREKAAAKAAAEKEHAAAAANGLPSPASTSSAPLPTSSTALPTRPQPPRDLPLSGIAPSQPNRYDDDDWGDDTESDDALHGTFARDSQHPPTNGTGPKSKKSKKKKKPKKEPVLEADPAITRPSGISREKIWNTSGPEERERIKQFWLGLGEDERKSLVKVEKDAVLRKMKEQQKHTCSCSVCGRKRTAIEEELEGLYDAYYQELESFANQPHGNPNGPPMFAAKRFGPMGGLHPPGVMPSRYSHHHPSRGRIVEHVDHDEDELEGVEEEYSEGDEPLDDEGEDEEEEDEEDDDDDEPEEIPRDTYPNDFFNFGQSLTVKGGILTVADDLLKNDGKKFIEMMEQLAERRMAREEEVTHYSTYSHTVNDGLSSPHNHPPPEDEEYDEEEEEEEYESQEEDYEEEEDQMTEEQRMEEGRRMFQIFAARMFEQRVLSAYREKVAKERQEKLLEELEQEETQESQRKAKKAKDAQKRKEKASQKKQALLEEKARREAEKAAEEQARSAEEARRTEEARAKAEERRKKKEAQKKAEEEERLRKEAERQRRAQEQKERQADQERKVREAKEREKKLKEEQRRKEQEAREIKERETRERREKHEKDKREKELRAAQAKAEREAKEKMKQEEKTTAKPASLAAPIPTQPARKQHPISIPALPQQPPPNHASPQIPVATPILPLAHTPMKPRSISQEVTRSVSQASHSASGPSQTASPHPMSPQHVSPGPIGPPSKTQSAGPPSQPMSPHHNNIKSPPGLLQSPFDMMMSLMPMQVAPGMPPGGHSFPRLHDPLYPGMGGQYRGPVMPGPPPGLGGPPVDGRAYHMPPPGFPQPGIEPHMVGLHQGFSSPDNAPGHPSPHTRQGSASFEVNLPSAQPIGKPTPIGRPGSISHIQREENVSADIEDMSNHLGSSALLDDADEPVLQRYDPGYRGTTAPGVRPPFPGPSFMNPSFGSPVTPWGAPGIFAPPPGFSHMPSSAAWPPNTPFRAPPPLARAAQPPSVVIRQLLVRACKELENYAADAAGYIDMSVIKGHVDSINPSSTESISAVELLEICETEGNPHNGGGSFDIRHDDNNKVAIRFEMDVGSGNSPFPRNVGAPGEIGSPIVGAGVPFARG